MTWGCDKLYKITANAWRQKELVHWWAARDFIFLARTKTWKVVQYLCICSDHTIIEYQYLVTKIVIGPPRWWIWFFAVKFSTLGNTLYLPAKRACVGFAGILRYTRSGRCDTCVPSIFRNLTLRSTCLARGSMPSFRLRLRSIWMRKKTWPKLSVAVKSNLDPSKIAIPIMAC